MSTTPEPSFEAPTTKRLVLPLTDGDVLSLNIVVDALGDRYAQVIGGNHVFNIQSDEVRLLADALDCWPEALDA